MAVYISPSFLSPYSSDIVVQGFPRCILWAPRKGYFWALRLHSSAQPLSGSTAMQGVYPNLLRFLCDKICRGPSPIEVRYWAYPYDWDDVVGLWDGLLLILPQKNCVETSKKSHLDG